MICDICHRNINGLKTINFQRYKELPYAQLIRKHLPEGSRGVTAPDIDKVLRLFSPSDPIGTFKLLEFKEGPSNKGKGLSHAQEMTFGLIDDMLTNSHPDNAFRYRGFYLLWCEDWEKLHTRNGIFTINNEPFTFDPFGIKFLNDKIQVPRYRFGI
jgi:hypothetical protein